MRLELKRHGGIAALERKADLVDTAKLPPEYAAKIHALVRALPAQGDRQVFAAEPKGADAFGYSLTITDDAGKVSTISFDAKSAPPELLELKSAIRAAAQAKAGG
jgi:hypothetical protein